MKPKTKPDPSLSSQAEQATHSANWSEREHVSEQSQVAAQSLVDTAGSPEHAKHAIDVVEQSQNASPGDKGTQVSPTTIKRNDQFVKALEDFENVTRNTFDVG
jgi:predicted transcriptional regulator